MRKHKISLEKVQKAFNDAIKRRDCKCVIKDFEPCYGGLEASHFFTVGGNPSLRFYPPNAYAQCSRHHWNHHNKKESANVYKNWLLENHFEEADFMARNRNNFIKYTDELKAKIIELCNADKLDELKELIEGELV